MHSCYMESYYVVNGQTIDPTHTCSEHFAAFDKSSHIPHVLHKFQQHLEILTCCSQTEIIERICLQPILISSNQKYQPFPCCHILPLVVFLRWLYHHMLPVSYVSLKSSVLFPLLLCSLMMCANNRVHFGMRVIFVLNHYHCYAGVSERIELLKCLEVHSIEYVPKIKSVLSISFMQYMELCVVSLHISLVMIVIIIYVLYLLS